MSERLSDERIELIRANCEKVIAGEFMQTVSVREVLSVVTELQDLRRYAATVKEWMLKPVKVET